MKNFFISQLALFLLILNGNIIGMNHAIKFLAYKNHQRFCSFAVNMPNENLENKTSNKEEATNNKNNVDEQILILCSTSFDPNEDKMAYFKQWKR